MTVGDSEARAQSVRARMRQLRVDYALRLPTKVSGLGPALIAGRSAADPAEQLEAIRMIAHQLHGTAGSYGFDGVAAAAVDLEQQLGRFDSSGGEREVLWDAIESAIAEVTRAAETASRGTIPTIIPPAISPTSSMLARILVVDDDEDFLRDLQKVASDRMIDVTTAQTESAALAALEGARFDGVIVNTQLGDGPEGADGFSVARQLRERSESDLCVCFMSGDDGMQNRVAAVHSGGALFLQKPISPNSLRDAAIQMASVARAERPRVLLVEDDEDFAQHVRVLLENHDMELVHEKDPARVLESLAQLRPDLVLLDVMMPGVSGLEVCQTIRSMPEWRDLLILFVSAQPSVETRMACFEAGGDDYLQKPILEQELLARTRVRLERARLARDRSERDSLTGLLNRRAFITAFGQRHAESRRHEGSMSLALLDIDHFKAINDTHGHLVGDQVLAAIGRHLSRSFRPADLRGRWGGEEFVIAIEGERADVARAIIERSLAELSRETFSDGKGETFHVTFSAGVASLPDDAGNLEDGLAVADRRLYAAKRGGRAMVVHECESSL